MKTLRAASALCLAASLQSPLEGQVSPRRPTGPLDAAVIPGTTGQNATGALALNVASGSNNQQLRSLVVGSGANALAIGSADQRMTVASPTNPSSAVIVQQDVFKNASGAMSVNVAAGDANQQANVGLLALGLTGLAASDSLLSQVRSTGHQEPGTPAPSSSNTAAVPSDAFGGAQGLVQINLTAGNRNSSANIFALTAAGGSF